MIVTVLFTISYSTTRQIRSSTIRRAKETRKRVSTGSIRISSRTDNIPLRSNYLRVGRESSGPNAATGRASIRDITGDSNFRILMPGELKIENRLLYFGS